MNTLCILVIDDILYRRRSMKGSMLIGGGITVEFGAGIFLVSFFFTINNGRRCHGPFRSHRWFGWQSWSG